MIKISSIIEQDSSGSKLLQLHNRGPIVLLKIIKNDTLKTTRQEKTTACEDTYRSVILKLQHSLEL